MDALALFQDPAERGKIVRAGLLAALEKLRGDVIGDEIVDALVRLLQALDAEELAVLGASPARPNQLLVEEPAP